MCCFREFLMTESLSFRPESGYCNLLQLLVLLTWGVWILWRLWFLIRNCDIFLLPVPIWQSIVFRLLGPNLISYVVAIIQVRSFQHLVFFILDSPVHWLKKCKNRKQRTNSHALKDFQKKFSFLYSGNKWLKKHILEKLACQ